jgi:hypothetical protein
VLAEALSQIIGHSHIALTSCGLALNKINVLQVEPPSLKLRRASCLGQTSIRSCEAQARSRTDGGGFEPPVPFGTHAFQACTINHSVTHPEQSSSSSES